MRKGIIVLVPFPFTNLSGQKVRPALVLYSDSGSDDFICCFISSVSKENARASDLKIKATPENGLKTDSIIKVAKIATLEKKIAIGELGKLDPKTINELDARIKIVFGL